ncbi:MAG: glycosyltransferase [Candidatus Omnitrophica bacterium]|nr:glycosyltransferase [Candidatus Omnitrophota bacterium]
MKNNCSQNKKKICFLSPKVSVLFFGKEAESFGGAEVALSFLGQELAKNQELDISFIVADYGQKEHESINNISFYKAFSFKDNFPVKIFKFLKQFFFVNADIYVQRTLTPFSFLIAVLSRALGKKFVYMVASDIEISGPSYGYLKKMQYKLSFSVMKISNIIIVQHDKQKQGLFDKGIKNNIYILQSGLNVDIPEYTKDREILWVGRAVEEKRPELFLFLAQQNPQYKFVMVLGGEKCIFSDDIEKRAKILTNLDLYRNVKFKNVHSYYERAKILVNTAEVEGFPFSFIQAMLYGTPIIALSCEAGSIVEKSKCGFWCDNKTNKMNEKLGLLMKDETLWNVLSNNSKDLVKKNNDIRNISQRFLEIIQ